MLRRRQRLPEMPMRTRWHIALREEALHASAPH
jgi:hypothetical protein